MVATTETTTLTEETTITTQQAAGLTRPSTGVPMSAGDTHRSVYYNGKMVPEHEARVSIFDSALMYGDMAFEMTRTYNHKPFCLREHLVRLYNSLKMMRIDPGMTIDEMEHMTLEVLKANMQTEPDDVDWQIMHDVSRGTMGIYHSIGEGGGNDGGPTVSINCWPLITHQGSYAPNYESGVNLVVSPVTQLPAHLLDLKAKTRSRLHYQMSVLNSQQYEGTVDPVLLDPDGYLAEGPGWNIFLVKDGVLLTPEGRNCLIGVSRQNTIKLATTAGIEVSEQNLGRYEAMTADEIFITSTTKALCWAKTWEGQVIGEGKPGPVYQRLMRAWKEHVECDFVEQAQEYARRLPAWRERDHRRHMAHQAQLTSGGGVHTVSMAKRPIPGTDLFVSPLCLGTMTFGTPVGQAEATAMIKRALELGVNFIDTANMYEGYTRSIGSRGEQSEIMIGHALRTLGAGARDQLVIATKVGMQVERGGKAEGGLSAEHIKTECARSLARLGVDIIDIYYAHKPDEAGVPLTESIAAFA
jgi:branched-chain amino acid aminotransferase